MANDSQNSEENGKIEYVRYIRGWAFPNTPLFRSENIIAALDNMPLDEDIIVCSYPKTGSTWMQYIVWQIIHKGESFPSFKDATHRLIPFLDLSGVKALEDLKPPRLYKTHCPFHLLKINEKAKYIYVYRRPSDTLVSFFHFEHQITGQYFPFDEYFEMFLEGKVSYGDYFDHVLASYTCRNNPNLLLVSYEDLHADKRGQILRIAKFLGNDYYNALLESDDLVQKVIDVTSFDYMKKNLTFTIPSKEGGEKKIDFFRKGTVGDGKNLLSASQTKRLRDKMLLKMEGTELVQKWENEDIVDIS